MDGVLGGLHLMMLIDVLNEDDLAHYSAYHDAALMFEGTP